MLMKIVLSGIMFFLLGTRSAYGQVKDSVVHASGKDTLNIIHQPDTLLKKIKGLFKRPAGKKGNQDTVRSDSTKQTTPDSTAIKLRAKQNAWQHELDSLKKKGLPTKALQHKLDSINKISGTPQREYQKIAAMQGKLEKSINPNALTDSVQVLQQAKQKMSEVNKVTSAAGIGPLGQGVTPSMNTSLPAGAGPPASPSLNTGIPTLNAPTAGGLPTGVAGNPLSEAEKSIGASVPNVNTNVSGLTNEAGAVKNVTGDINGVAKDAGQITKEAQVYTNEVKDIQQNGVGATDKILEQQAQKITELQGFEKEKAQAEQEMKQYKDMIEQYKNEKAIKAEIEKKSKELAFNKMALYEGKVKESMTKVSKSSKKFSHVQDARYLPKRAPNPMKALGWRERVVPGFTLQNINRTKAWVELSPQVYYKINGRWSAGAGWAYRFSMNASKLTFADFGTLNGYRAFAHWSMFKGFFIRAEVGRAAWKPWTTIPLSDRMRKETVTTAAIGIGKNYNLSKKTKGTMQTLYHFTRGKSDPYKPVIEIRVGFDFSLKKKEHKAWEKKLKELEK